jgi:hypothetical protein
MAWEKVQEGSVQKRSVKWAQSRDVYSFPIAGEGVTGADREAVERLRHAAGRVTERWMRGGGRIGQRNASTPTTQRDQSELHGCGTWLQPRAWVQPRESGADPRLVAEQALSPANCHRS